MTGDEPEDLDHERPLFPDVPETASTGGRSRWLLAVIPVACLLLIAGGLAARRGSSDTSTDATEGITGDFHKIKHVVMIMQENRSFDHYFGTFPGADGFTMKDGKPAGCLPSQEGVCVPLFHDGSDGGYGGPHADDSAKGDINGGKMDGFIKQAQLQQGSCKDPTDPGCAVVAGKGRDVAGYKTEQDIPNYWDYAQNFVLQDHMFGPNAGWSLPAHQYLVSAWGAQCARVDDPMSCHSAPNGGQLPPDFGSTHGERKRPDPTYSWTDITFLLHKQDVSWHYYVSSGDQPDCANDNDIKCATVKQNAKTPGIWNPLPWFRDVQQNNQVGNIVDTSTFFADAGSGNLPAVSWLAPSFANSEHPPAKISDGQAYVTKAINAIMSGPDWDSTAIFLAWDDWGGYYDHVVPPTVDNMGYGLRVPALLISAYAKRGFVDHQVLSFDAYLKFIEDLFLDRQRLDPKTDGRPDSRPVVRENVAILGDLRKEFDFNQPPRPPTLLPERPASVTTPPSLGPTSPPNK